MRSSQRITCAVCGQDTGDAVDYVELSLTTDYTDGFQVLGAHAACLNSVLPGRPVEVHLFGKADPGD